MIIFNGITIIKHRPWLQANEARDESSWGNDGPTDFVRGRGSVKLSKDHHATIEEERNIPHTSKT